MKTAAPQRVTQDDLWGAAVHEGGHAVLAEHYTGKAARITLTVKSNSNGDSWISGATYFTSAGDPQADIAIALAGPMAEVLCTGSPDRHLQGAQFVSAFWARCSRTDLDNATRAKGRPIELDDVVATERAVRQHLTQIESRAVDEVMRFQEQKAGRPAAAPAARPAALARGAAADDGDDGPGGIIVMVRGQRLYAKSAAHAALLAHDAARWRGPGTGGAQVL